MKRVLSRPHVASVYVHWPFCTKLCNYCNFNKYVASKNVELNEKLGQCLQIEAQSLMNKGHVDDVESIYFGGGTPSLMSPEQIEVLNSQYFPLEIEISKVLILLRT